MCDHMVNSGITAQIVIISKHTFKTYVKGFVQAHFYDHSSLIQQVLLGFLLHAKHWVGYTTGRRKMWSWISLGLCSSPEEKVPLKYLN